MVSSSVTSSSPVVGACTVTCALSVAKLTVAVTPGRRVKRFSTRATHEEHVIPETARSSSTTGSAAGVKVAGAKQALGPATVTQQPPRPGRVPRPRPPPAAKGRGELRAEADHHHT